MKIHGGIFCILCYTFMVLKWKVSHLKCLNHLNHNIAINSTSSHQCSIVLLFSITRLRLSREGIKNHLYITQLKSIASKIRGPPEPVAHRTWPQPHCTGQVYGQLYLLLQFWLQFAFLLAWLVLLSSPDWQILKRVLAIIVNYSNFYIPTAYMIFTLILNLL